MTKLMRYLCKYYYIGKSKYHGSQIQTGVETIENTILKALIKKKYISSTEDSGFGSASRTDRQVSARAACFSFLSSKEPILMEINSALPKDMGLWAHLKVSMDFHVRFNALLRHYKYIVPKPLKLLEKEGNFDLDMIKKACSELEGRHDFKNFSKRDKENVKTIRDMQSIKMSIREGFLIFDFKSQAFLRQQIRRTVKKIIEVGKGVISLEELKEMFDPSNEFSYQPADPLGLILWDISFGERIQLKEDPKSVERMKRFFYNQKINYGQKYQFYKELRESF